MSARNTPLALIVGVDPDLLASCGTALHLEGCNHVVVQSAELATARAEEQQFDLAICEMDLPGADGIEALAFLRDAQPACMRLLCARRLDLETVTRAVNLGCVDHVLEAPVDDASVRTALGGILRRRPGIAEAYRVRADAKLLQERDHLDAAIAGNFLRLALQPIVQSGDARIHGYEALLRSSHPAFAGTMDLLGAAERHGRLSSLADAVAARAAVILGRGRRLSKLFLNVHPVELASPEDFGARMATLERWSSQIVLEITERGSSGLRTWAKSLDLIRALGFDFALDDLGAGHSTLSVLAELQPSYFKIDMSIVRGVDASPRKRRLIELLCEFARATGTMVVAEGVETMSEAITLRTCGAQLMQGYFFGVPR